jgi:RNA polymerase sigma-70 factor (ECF subfamily)
MMLLDYWSNIAKNAPTTTEASRKRPARAATAEDVFYAYAPRVYSVARRMLGNDADAEDVTQDVLLQVVRKLDTFRGESGLTTWLHRVTVNAALLHRRKQTRRREQSVRPPLDVLPNAERVSPTRSSPEAPEQRVLDRETHELIERAIARLPEIYRDVYVLADVEGLSNAEIGEILELAVPAVKSRLHRARLMMREALTPHF